jgi:hypothetical protein
MRAAGEVMQALDDAAKGVQAASTELSKLTEAFYESHLDGERVVLGTGLQFDCAVRDELAVIYTDAIENDRRPPAEDIRAAMAQRAVQAKRPDLWAEYHGKKARIEALKSWITNQRAAISANQSILRGERS